ncbi:MAG: hypothetical protein IPN16_01940 [Gemmatimonadetes bacterium]|nr:hypothetical protein [Gemmatimonadota bacterium]
MLPSDFCDWRSSSLRIGEAWEAKVVTSNIWRDHTGQVFAFLLAAGAMGGGFDDA